MAEPALAHVQRLGWAWMTGVVGALAFPAVIPGLGSTPVLDWAPRELLLLALIVGLYRDSRSDLSFAVWGSSAFARGLGFFGALLPWIAVAMTQFGGMPWWQALPVMALLVAYCASYDVLMVVVARAAARGAVHPAWRLVCFVGAVVACEWLREHAFSGFPWGAWGYALARVQPLVQVASVGGVALLTAWVTGVAALVVELVTARVAEPGPSRRRWVVGLAAWLAVGLVGGAVVDAMRGSDVAAATRVAVLQANIAQTVKNRSDAFEDEIRQAYLSLAKRAVEEGRAELVVWPEAAWPGRLHPDARQAPVRLGVPSLFGAATLAWRPDPVATNSVFWVEPNGHIGARYDKQKLVPFGEFVPLRSILPVDRFVPGMVDFTAGSQSTLLGEPAWGALVCYDGIFAAPARQAVRSGAAWLANLTNDGWYGVSSGPYQHLDFYRLRAIENDRWLVRATNSGVSALVGPDGRIRAQSALHEVAVLVGEVAPRTTHTLFVRLGPWVEVLGAGLLCVAVLRWLYLRQRIGL